MNGQIDRIRFTRHQNGWVEFQVKLYMDAIVDEILKGIDGTVSIVLAGGAGRGETSVKVCGRKVLPVNDLDIYVITDNPVSEKVLHDVAEKATARLNLGMETFSFYRTSPTMLDKFYIDLRNHTRSELAHLPPLLKYYEIRYSGTVLYGEDVLSDMPDYSLDDVPMAEGARFLLNRLCSFCEYFLPEYLNRQLAQPERETVIYFCGKVFLSIAEALTLLSGKFESSYERRCQILEETYQQDFPELYSKMPDLPAKVRMFTDFRAAPNFNGFPHDPVATWFTTRDYAWVVVQYYLEKLFKIERGGNMGEYSRKMHRNMWKSYLNEYLRSVLKDSRLGFATPLLPVVTPLAHLYLNLKYLSRIWALERQVYLKPLLDWKAPDLKLYAALPLILFSIDRTGKIDDSMLLAARSYLTRLFPSRVNGGLTYEGIHQSFGTAYRLYAHSNIV